MANEPSYTNVRMDANSALGQWWRHQSDRDYSMQVLVQLANQKFGKNVDLKAYSLQQMINGNAAPLASQPQTPVTTNPNTEPETKTVDHNPSPSEPAELRQSREPDQTPAASQPNDEPLTPPSHASSATNADANDDALVHDALFGGTTKPVKAPRKKGQSFRDQL